MMMAAGGADDMPRGFRRRMRQFGLPPWMMQEEGDDMEGGQEKDTDSDGEGARDSSPEKSGKKNEGGVTGAKADGKPTAEEASDNETNQPGPSGTQKESDKKVKITQRQFCCNLCI